jgi:transposase
VGRGGIKAIATATGVHPDTVARGVREVTGEPEPAVRVRERGGGRKRLTETDPELVTALQALVDPATRGDAMSLLVWTTKSTRKLAAALSSMGHRVSDRTVARMLREMGFSLRGNAKVVEGRQHEDRDAQFPYLNSMVTAHAGAGQPVIRADRALYGGAGSSAVPAPGPSPNVAARATATTTVATVGRSHVWPRSNAAPVLALCRRRARVPPYRQLRRSARPPGTRPLALLGRGSGSRPGPRPRRRTTRRARGPPRR